MKHTNYVLFMGFSPDGRRIATAYEHDGAVQIWDALSGTRVSAMEGHDSNASVLSVNISPDGRRIVSGSSNKSIRVWDITTGAAALPTIRAHLDHVNSVMFSPDGKTFVSGSSDGTVRIWDTTTGAKVLVMDGLNSVQRVAFFLDGTTVVSSSQFNIRVWESMTGVLLLTLQEHTLDFPLLADECRVISGSYDGPIFIRDVNTGSKVSELRGHVGQVESVCYSPDRRQIISGSVDKTVRIWDMQSEEILPAQRLHNSSVDCIAFSSDGHRVISGSIDGTARILDANTAFELIQLEGHELGVISVAFSPDGRRVATGPHDRTARIWDANTGAMLLTLRGHMTSVLSVAFFLDGRRISTSSDGDRIRDANTGSHLPTGNIFGIRQTISHEIATGRRLHPGREINDSPPRSVNIVVKNRRWIVDSVTSRTISQLPPMVPMSCVAMHETSLAVGTKDGRVLVIRLPLALFTSPDTRLEDSVSKRRRINMMAQLRPPALSSRDVSGGAVLWKLLFSLSSNSYITADLTHTPTTTLNRQSSQYPSTTTALHRPG
jgi:WD40 repeat protein